MGSYVNFGNSGLWVGVGYVEEYGTVWGRYFSGITLSSRSKLQGKRGRHSRREREDEGFDSTVELGGWEELLGIVKWLFLIYFYFIYFKTF